MSSSQRLRLSICKYGNSSLTLACKAPQYLGSEICLISNEANLKFELINSCKAFCCRELGEWKLIFRPLESFSPKKKRLPRKSHLQLTGKCFKIKLSVVELNKVTIFHSNPQWIMNKFFVSIVVEPFSHFVLI